MIHEYAVEPELVATWTNPRDYRYFIENLSRSHGRLVSRFPKKWAPSVWQAFDIARKAAPDRFTDFDRLRLEELMKHLKANQVRRSSTSNFTQNTSWLDRALEEHKRTPFHAILARDDSSKHPHVINAENLDHQSERWSIPTTVVVRRTAEEMAAAVAPLLRFSSTIIFVDPYFDPHARRYLRPFKKFLKFALEKRPGALPTRVEIYSKITSTTSSESHFRYGCGSKLSKCIPDGMKITVQRLEEIPNGERLHNRYILTDVGGLKFGFGLDEDDSEGATDDITILGEDSYATRFHQYNNAGETFRTPENSIELQGKRPQSSSSG